MIRKIIKINQEKCNGCGLCAEACHEEAIGIKNGKAVLLRDDYCDGLGDCLPVCPVDAISFEEREAAEYNEAEVKRNMERKRKKQTELTEEPESELRQWPVQIKLVPVNAPYFEGADLLIAADCTAYAYAGFHQTFMKDKVTVIGCPKLDMEDYAEKLTEIFKHNDIKSISVARMEVPCCGGLEYAAKRAAEQSGKELEIQVVTISVDGKILKR